MLGAKFPGIPAPFPEQGGFFAHFGQNLRFSGHKNKKIAAKFAAAGNLKLRDVSQFLDSPPPATALPVIVFHSIFP
jgi:hypothetical protein